MDKHLVRAQESCACTRSLCMHKNLVHAKESCACTRFLCMILCMHKIPVHAQDSCACTRFLCMHKNLVHAQEFLCMHKCCLNYSVNRCKSSRHHCMGLSWLSFKGIFLWIFYGFLCISFFFGGFSLDVYRHFQQKRHI